MISRIIQDNFIIRTCTPRSYERVLQDHSFWQDQYNCKFSWPAHFTTSSLDV